MTAKQKIRIGWRELISLPELGIKSIKAKVDTGARTSSVHAENIKLYRRGKSEFVSFDIAPIQRSQRGKVHCTAEVVDFRRVKSSNGMTEMRPVIETEVKLGGLKYVTEVTLTNRDEMGFRMLLGRQSLKMFLVDSSASFLSQKLEKKQNTKRK